MEYEYCQNEHKAFTRDGKYIIATLDIASDTFRTDEDISEEDAEHYYIQMRAVYEDFKEFLKKEEYE